MKKNILNIIFFDKMIFSVDCVIIFAKPLAIVINKIESNE